VEAAHLRDLCAGDHTHAQHRHCKPTPDQLWTMCTSHCLHTSHTQVQKWCRPQSILWPLMPATLKMPVHLSMHTHTHTFPGMPLTSPLLAGLHSRGMRHTHAHTPHTPQPPTWYSRSHWSQISTVRSEKPPFSKLGSKHTTQLLVSALQSTCARSSSATAAAAPVPPSSSSCSGAGGGASDGPAVGSAGTPCACVQVTIEGAHTQLVRGGTRAQFVMGAHAQFLRVGGQTHSL